MRKLIGTKAYEMRNLRSFVIGMFFVLSCVKNVFSQDVPTKLQKLNCALENIIKMYSPMSPIFKSDDAAGAFISGSYKNQAINLVVRSATNLLVEGEFLIWSTDSGSSIRKAPVRYKAVVSEFYDDYVVNKVLYYDYEASSWFSLFPKSVIHN